jgi:hypothetical protein
MKKEEKNKNTFIVKIDHQQNSTWQGQVVWAEEERSERFRSALELIRLMDEAMDRPEQGSLGERGIV